MAKQAIRVKGDKELARAFKEMRREVLRELRPALRKIGEIVRQDAAARFASYDERSSAGYKVRVRLRGVAVEQSLKRTTGAHPQYGTLQMERALLPARDDKQAEVVASVETLVSVSASRNGF
jgi:hypothetical protein